jgi:hypothetical protein
MKKLFLISALTLALASCSTSTTSEETTKTDSTACCVKGDTTLVDSVKVDTALVK